MSFRAVLRAFCLACMAAAAVAPAPAQESAAVGAPEIETRVLKRDQGAMSGRQSLAASGHFVAFETPPGRWRLRQVQLFASRYGTVQAPEDTWRITVCDRDFSPLKFIDMPYATFERGVERWYEVDVPTLDLPAGEPFWLNLAFNPHETRGVHVGYDRADLETHSRIGLPGGRITGMPRKMDWMIRAVIVRAAAEGMEDESRSWQSPPKGPEPFEKLGLVELTNDDGTSEGYRSFGDAGPAVRFENATDHCVLVRIRIYASRYGSGYDPEREAVDYWVFGEDGSVVASGEFSYGVFTYEESWAEIELPPAKVPSAFRVLINPHADARKGVYFHYDASGSAGRARVGCAPENLREVDGEWEWMIRAYLAREPLGEAPATRE